MNIREKVLKNGTVPIMEDEGLRATINCLVEAKFAGVADNGPSRKVKLSSSKSAKDSIEPTLAAWNESGINVYFHAKQKLKKEYEKNPAEFMQKVKEGRILFTNFSEEDVKTIINFKDEDFLKAITTNNIESLPKAVITVFDQVGRLKVEHIGESGYKTSKSGSGLPYEVKDFETSGNKARKYTNRIYLNTPIGPELNKFVEIYAKKCIDRGIPFNLKAGFNSETNDRTILYAYNEHLDDVLEILEEIKKENPELIDNFGSPIPAALNYSYYAVSRDWRLRGGLTYNDAFTVMSLDALTSLAAAKMLESEGFNKLDDKTKAIIEQLSNVESYLKVYDAHLEHAGFGMYEMSAAICKDKNTWKAVKNLLLNFLVDKYNGEYPEEFVSEYKETLKSIASIANFKDLDHKDSPISLNAKFYGETSSKKETKSKTEKKVVKRTTVVSRNLVEENQTYKVSDEVYKVYTHRGKNASQFDMFSLIGALSENADIFFQTKDKYRTILKYIYTADELNEIMKNNGAKDLDALATKVQKIADGGKMEAQITPVMQKVSDFVSGKLDSSKINPSYLEEAKRFAPRENGAIGFVKNVCLYLNNDELNKKSVELFKLTPLNTPSNLTEEEQDEVLNKTIEFVESKCGYRSIIDSETEKETIGLSNKRLVKDLNCNLSGDSFQNSVNILYNVAKNMRGSKNIHLSKAKSLINLTAADSSLSDKNIAKMFNSKKDLISDVVSLITTSFLARFVLDSKSYAEVNAELAVQTAKKMQELVFSPDGLHAKDLSSKDYWLVKFIKDRVMLNVSEITANNNIFNAQELFSIYEKNGTILVNPKDIRTIEDLVFAKQINTGVEKEKSQVLENGEESKVNSPELKNSKRKCVKPISSFKKIKTIVKSDKYKPIYEAAYKARKLEIEKAIEEAKAANITRENLDSIMNKGATSAENKKARLEDMNLADKSDTAVEQLVEDYAKANADVDLVTELKNEAEAAKNAEETTEETENKEEKIEEVVNTNEEESKNVEETAETSEEDKSSDKNETEEVKKEDEKEEMEQPKTETENVENEKSQKKYFTEPKVRTPEELQQILERKISKMCMDSILEVGNFTSVSDSKRLENNTQLKKSFKILKTHIKQLAEALSVDAAKYYLDIQKHNDITVADRPSTILKAYFNNICLNQPISSSSWKKNMQFWLAVFLAQQANEDLKIVGVELSIDEKSFKKYSELYKESYQKTNKKINLIKKMSTENVETTENKDEEDGLKC